MSVTRSPGIPITANGMPTGYLAGGGFTGDTEDLDALVTEAADKLAAGYPGFDVTVRFNSDRQSGSAWLVTDIPDGIWKNSQIGICAGHRLTRRRAIEDLRWTPEQLADDERFIENPWDDEDGLYVVAHVIGELLHDPAEAENTGERSYTHRRMPDVDAAIAWCLSHARTPEKP